MAEITAQMVKELREMTGLGMMECKKALTETGGDMKAAEDLLRIKSGAKASKAAGRTAAEGMVAAHIARDGRSGALVEVNCETDFVARNEDFISFAHSLAELLTTESVADNEALANAMLSNGESVEEFRKALVMRLGENISIRRFSRHQVAGSQDRLASYLHGAKIGVMVDYTGGNQALGKDLAMHIAASKPVCVSSEQVSPELLERERQIYTAQAAESGKPADIVAAAHKQRHQIVGEADGEDDRADRHRCLRDPYGRHVLSLAHIVEPERPVDALHGIEGEIDGGRRRDHQAPQFQRPPPRAIVLEEVEGERHADMGAPVKRMGECQEGRSRHQVAGIFGRAGESDAGPAGGHLQYDGLYRGAGTCH